MADIEGIARKLYNIIISPDTVTGLINGGLSVPLGKLRLSGPQLPI